MSVEADQTLDEGTGIREQPDPGVELALRGVRAIWPEASLTSQIRELTPESRNAVWRVTAGGDRAVLKVARQGGLAAEAAALRALAGDGAPHLLARGDGWLLAEDLGTSASIERSPALAALGAVVGRIHARTANFSWEQPAVDVDHAVHRWRRGLAGLRETLASAGLRVSSAGLRDLERVVRVLSHPGSARVLSHGDVDFANAVFRDGTARLVDWEVAGPRHAGFDWLPAVQHRLRAHPSPPTPSEVSAFEGGYLAENRLPDLALGVAAAAVAWAAVAAMALPSRLRADRVQGTASHRWRITTSLVEASVWSAAQWPALARDLARAGAQLAERWPDSQR